MLAKEQLWSKKHPYINFHANSCEVEGDTIIPDGTLDIRGVELPMAPKLTFSLDEKLSIQGEFSIKHTSFGFKPYSGLMGAVKNKNTIDISFSLQK